MLQVLFRIPIITRWTPDGIALYGFGLMLFLALFAAMWLAVRRAAKEGIDQERLYDLAWWVFLGGLIGARIVYMIQYKVPIGDWYKFWEGGIVFYGSAIGGWIGYGLAWWFSFRKHKVSTWRLADAVAPAVCLGLLLGRVGCLFNGCCYGHVSMEGGVSYPTLTCPARELVVNEGYQTAAGFTLDESAVAMMGKGPAVVGAIEPGSAAAEAGLKRDDHILSANGIEIKEVHQLQSYLLDGWPRGKTDLALLVRRDGKELEVKFTPKTLKLHPTQVYESISMALLLFVLLTYYPYRRHHGQLFVVLMIGYAFHRFFNETLRNDTDPVFLNLTLSQVGSLGVLAAAIGLEVYLRRFSPRVSATPPPDQGGSGPKKDAQGVQADVPPR